MFFLQNDLQLACLHLPLNIYNKWDSSILTLALLPFSPPSPHVWIHSVWMSELLGTSRPGLSSSGLLLKEMEKVQQGYPAY